MYMSRFGVKNYKCLGEIDIPLTPIHVLIGENDAGKTSLLEAIAALHASSEKDLSDVFPEPWEGRELVFHGSSEPRIELWGEWTGCERMEGAPPESVLRYGFAVDFPPKGRSCVTFGDWMEGNGERRTLAPNAPLGRTAFKAFNMGWAIPQADYADLKTISMALKQAHKYALDAKLMAVPAAYDQARKFRLDSDGFGLATLLDDITGHEPERLIRLREEFCAYFPQFRSFHIELETALKRNYPAANIAGGGTADGKGIYFETRQGDCIKAQQASDGAILFLGFLALAYLPNPPNLLLIEEPENGIYPKRLGEVIKLLKELVNRTEGVRFPQIIMSTHSPYVLSFFEPEEVTFLSRPPDEPGGPVRARPLRDAPDIHERMGGGFYLGELWYNLSEKELFRDP